MQALVWLHMVQFRAVWFSVIQFGTSYTNLRQPHILTSSCIQVNRVLL